MSYASPFAARTHRAAPAGDSPPPRFPLRPSGDTDARPRRRLRILVADDEPDTVRTLTKILELEGHEIVAARDGGEALKAVRKSRPDAVLLDIGMPGLTGYDVARALRALYGADCPLLIAVSAYATTPDRLVGKAAGFDFHFGKPFEIDGLLTALSQAKRRGEP